MRRATAWVVVVGVAMFGTASSASAADGFWVSIASGVAGSSSPSGYQELWFETPHGPPPVAVTRLSSGTAEATTAGGSSFFSGAAVPVVLHTTDGYAYLTGGPKPSDLSNALHRQTAGGQGLASATPEASATSIPPNAVQLTADFTDPDLLGIRSLTVGVTDPLSVPIGTGMVVIPNGGWWVIGLGPGENDVVPPPPPLPDPPPPPPVVLREPPPVLGPVATPEPATGLLLGLGGLTAGAWRLINRRRKPLPG